MASRPEAFLSLKFFFWSIERHRLEAERLSAAHVSLQCPFWTKPSMSEERCKGDIKTNYYFPVAAADKCVCVSVCVCVRMCVLCASVPSCVSMHGVKCMLQYKQKIRYFWVYGWIKF